ncbi:MAG TPA: FtsX-like permease family protein [Bacteroides sp.]|nr:FtsX-like permease family protein [Bacteroides sp.]
MIAFKLAYRNLMGAGLRTFLIVFILSVSYVLIIFMNGLYQGWNHHARADMIDWEVGQGQFWQEQYDPYDPFTYADAHAPVPPEIKTAAEQGRVTPILLSQATIYPEGRIQSIKLKGIAVQQDVLSVPTDKLVAEDHIIPALAGTRMAKSARLEEGDYLLVRWRDVNGTFDAAEVKITGIFSSPVPAVDAGQIWIPLDQMQEMLQMPGEATLIVSGKGVELPGKIPGWEFRDHDFLFAELEAMIKTKSTGGSILYLILLALALLAVFDTQVLSIFRRQREIGTYISMGMTRRQVVGLFTVEGTMHAILALALAAVYGIPLLLWFAKTGLGMPEGTDSFGLASAERILPYYSAAVITGTILLIMITTTIVSYMPARKISKMNPTEAIRGKIQ